jgi:hypothetical protein
MLTVIWPGLGSAREVVAGEGPDRAAASVAQCVPAPAADAFSPVKTSTSCRLPQPITPKTTTDPATTSTSLPRRRGLRIRGYLFPVIRYFPPMPGGVSMLMGAA